MEINHVTESFARAYTEPFPPKVLVARAKKKLQILLLVVQKRFISSCKRGRPPHACMHTHSEHLEPASLHFAQLKITRHNADCTSTRQSVVQMPENNAENNAEEGVVGIWVTFHQ